VSIRQLAKVSAGISHGVITDLESNELENPLSLTKMSQLREGIEKLRKKYVSPHSNFWEETSPLITLLSPQEKVVIEERLKGTRVGEIAGLLKTHSSAISNSYANGVAKLEREAKKLGIEDLSLENLLQIRKPLLDNLTLKQQRVIPGFRAGKTTTEIAAELTWKVDVAKRAISSASRNLFLHALNGGLIVLPQEKIDLMIDLARKRLSAEQIANAAKLDTRNIIPLRSDRGGSTFSYLDLAISLYEGKVVLLQPKNSNLLFYKAS